MLLVTSPDGLAQRWQASMTASASPCFLPEEGSGAVDVGRRRSLQAGVLDTRCSTRTPPAEYPVRRAARATVHVHPHTPHRASRRIVGWTTFLLSTERSTVDDSVGLKKPRGVHHGAWPVHAG